MKPALQLDPDAVCGSCGCFGAFRFETEALCADCYAARGSCCSGEFEGRAAVPGATAEAAPDPKPTSR